MPKPNSACLALAGALALACLPAAAQPPISYSPDTLIRLGSLTLGAEAVAEDDRAGALSLIDLGRLPAGVNVDAFSGAADGERLFSTDVTVTLGGRVFSAGQLIRYDGNSYGLAFPAAGVSLPTGVNLTAVSRDGDSDALLLGFDTTVALGDVVAGPRDLIRFAGGNLELAFAGAANGVRSGLRIDAAERLADGRLLLSFDGTGRIASQDLTFDDEDILMFDPSKPSDQRWSLGFDGSAETPAWIAANLDAVSAPNTDGQLIFRNDFEN